MHFHSCNTSYHKQIAFVFVFFAETQTVPKINIRRDGAYVHFRPFSLYICFLIRSIYLQAVDEILIFVFVCPSQLDLWHYLYFILRTNLKIIVRFLHVHSHIFIFQSSMSSICNKDISNICLNITCRVTCIDYVYLARYLFLLCVGISIYTYIEYYYQLKWIFIHLYIIGTVYKYHRYDIQISQVRYIDIIGTVYRYHRYRIYIYIIGTVYIYHSFTIIRR